MKFVCIDSDKDSQIFCDPEVGHYNTENQLALANDRSDVSYILDQTYYSIHKITLGDPVIHVYIYLLLGKVF